MVINDTWVLSHGSYYDSRSYISSVCSEEGKLEGQIDTGLNKTLLIPSIGHSILSIIPPRIGTLEDSPDKLCPYIVYPKFYPLRFIFVIRTTRS